MSWTPLFYGHRVTHVRDKSSAKVPLGHTDTHVLVPESPNKLAIEGQVVTHK